MSNGLPVVSSSDPRACGRQHLFFVSAKRGNSVVFVQEFLAGNLFLAMETARSRMVEDGIATRADFSRGEIRFTHIGELSHSFGMEARL